MRPTNNKNDGPFPSSVFPPSVFPRSVFPWMGNEDDDLPRSDLDTENGQDSQTRKDDKSDNS